MVYICARGYEGRNYNLSFDLAGERKVGEDTYQYILIYV